MNKSEIIAAMQAEVAGELRRLQAANEAAAAGATDSESRAESKWDTQGLESSYLARGYAQQFEVLTAQAEKLREFEAGDFSQKPVGIGALVECELNGYRSLFFLFSGCGGMELNVEEESITVITPESPIGAALMSKQQGSVYTLPTGVAGSIVRVW